MYDIQDKTEAPEPIRSVYVIGCDGLWKVGLARNVKKRLSGLQQGSVHAMWIAQEKALPEPMAKSVEFRAHRLLASFRVRGEWYECGFQRVRRAIAVAIAEQRPVPLPEDREQWLARYADAVRGARCVFGDKVRPGMGGRAV